MNSISHLQDWIPSKLHVDNTCCEWLYVSKHRFTEPFFDDTIAVCRRNFQENRKQRVVSHLDMMLGWSELQSVSPTAIIFHVSRCGSTLLSQLLAMDEKHISLSEVPFFDEILRLPKGTGTPVATEPFLSAAIRLYGQARLGTEERLFIKTDSWHLHFYHHYRALFGNIPFILLYRDPYDVIRSQHLHRGWQSVPGMIEPEVFGFEPGKYPIADLDLYMARVIATFFKQMIAIIEHDANAFAFDYADGIPSILEQIYHIVGLPLSKEQKDSFSKRCRYDSKTPQQDFVEETERVQLPRYKEPDELYSHLKSMDKRMITQT